MIARQTFLAHVHGDLIVVQNDMQRFILVMAEILNTSFSDEDPFRFTKRKLLENAKESLSDGIKQAEDSLRLIKNIETDMKDYENEKLANSK